MDLNAASIIRPKYYSHFQCTPVDCLETCCERWQIQIDPQTYERYHNCEDGSIRRIAKRYVKEKEEKRSRQDHAYIQLDPMGRCPFLNEEDYCSVQLTLGEEALSKTCRFYPRVITKADEKTLVGLETTCSVAAREILFDPEAMEVDPQPVEEHLHRLLADAHNAITVSTDTIWIQQQVIRLLRDRRYTIDERLHHVGAHLIRVLAGHHPDEVAEEKGYHVFNSRTFEHLNHLLSIKFPAGDRVGFFSKLYPTLLNEVLDGFDRMPSGREEEVYSTTFNRQVMDYLEKRPYVIENYIVNHVYLYGSMHFREEQIWRFYLESCLIVALLQFHLVGLALKKKRLSDDHVLPLVQSFTRTFVQDRGYFDEALMYLISHKLDTSETIAGLILPV